MPKGTDPIRKYLALALMAVALAGCVPDPAVIADLETDKVIVQSGIGTPAAAIFGKAVEGCALHGRRPLALSVQCLDRYCHYENHLIRVP